ncbi:MAG: GNAT family N-acetyltransferase [Alphaproteobacteria bacterium]|nr:GNAT family N-acetyltransferase [Alphaproteobacteria bacterium]|tara:strand:+ start:523 stop:984 length:462 start_codon:yes stop_codon:yes gene_type:complete
MLPNNLDWSCLSLTEMEPRQLFELFKIRQEIFVIEQSCIYPDIDKYDLSCWHLLGYGFDLELHAYCRLLKPGGAYEEPTIGRVLVVKEYRGLGLARNLMSEAHRRCESILGTKTIRLNAQVYLQKFYESIGYKSVSLPYDEDGIMHIEMLRTG